MIKFRGIIFGAFLVIVLVSVVIMRISAMGAFKEDPCKMNDKQEGKVVTGEQGWTFFGITIGKSSYRDVVSIIGEPDHRTPLYREDNKPVGCVFQYLLDKDDIMNPRARYIWFSGGTVIAIEFSSPGYPVKEDNESASLEDMKNLYGLPDIVDFNKSMSYSRTVIWLHKGIQARIAFAGDTNSSTNNTPIELVDARVSSVYYYLPIDIGSFNEAIFSQISDGPPVSDVVDLFPRDPFSWSK